MQIKIDDIIARKLALEAKLPSSNHMKSYLRSLMVGKTQIEIEVKGMLPINLMTELKARLEAAVPMISATLLREVEEGMGDMEKELQVIQGFLNGLTVPDEVASRLDFLAEEIREEV